MVTRNDRGELEGFGLKGARAYRRFLKVLAALEPGEIMMFSYWFKRWGPLHRLHFKMLTELHEAQELYPEFESFRLWVTMGAGHVYYILGSDGQDIPAPRSISYEDCDDEEFAAHHENVKEFMRGRYAQSRLWPHLPAYQSSETVESIIQEFERERQQKLQDHT